MAVSLGIYCIPAEYLYPGYSAYVDGWRYLHLVQRTAQFSYRAYVAETREELETTTIMVEVTSDQLEHAEFLSSPKPISYYVAPASVLPHYLRIQFSAAGLFYFHSAGPREDEFQPVRIVATAERLSNPETRSCIIDFTEEELRQAVLLTPELRRLATSDLRAVVEAYAESKVINHQLYSDPAARSFATIFEKAPDESLANLQRLSTKERASIEEDESRFVRHAYIERFVEETPLHSAIERGKLTIEKLEDLQRELEEPLFCLLQDRKPLENAEVFVEEEEIEPVYVSQKMVEKVCEEARTSKNEPFSPLTWRRKMVLRSAIWEIDQQLQKRLKAAKRQALEEQSWAIRLVLVNEQTSNYRRVQIMPVAASSVTPKGFFVHLYRKAA